MGSVSGVYIERLRQAKIHCIDEKKIQLSFFGESDTPFSLSAKTLYSSLYNAHNIFCMYQWAISASLFVNIFKG